MLGRAARSRTLTLQPVKSRATRRITIRPIASYENQRRCHHSRRSLVSGPSMPLRSPCLRWDIVELSEILADTGSQSAFGNLPTDG